MPAFTCITCRVSFADSEIQRRHYKTDWHRYNLKRKVAEMPPVTAEVFQQKVIAQKAEVEAQQQIKITIKHCDLCNKTFSSENAYQNHMRSKKHKELDAEVAKVGNVATKESGNGSSVDKSRRNKQDTVELNLNNALSLSNNDDVDDDDIEEDTLEITDCLFCPHHSISLEENMKHMTRSHSFFIPDLEFVVDLKGLLGYLGEKVSVGNMCLYCGDKGKNFFSTEAVQDHMVDKGHTKINYDGDAVLEYADFYDFSSSYPDYNPDVEHQGDSVGVQSTDSVLAVNDHTLELYLPSGAKIGHRTLRHIYRQNLPSEQSRHSKVIRNIMADHRALGWQGTISGTTRQKVKDIRLQNMRQAKRKVDVSVKANRLQKHYRAQVLF